MKKKIKPVMFLFGCESVSLQSAGSYSEMIGPHMHFTAAKWYVDRMNILVKYYNYCFVTAFSPAVIGTLMPGLDAHMDLIATELLSRWITSNSLKSLSWYNIDKTAWIKSGDIIGNNFYKILLLLKSLYILNIIIKLFCCLCNISVTVESYVNHKGKRTIEPYQRGSLCYLIADIHRYADRNKLYNTVSYVYRGIPVWNCSIEPLEIS